VGDGHGIAFSEGTSSYGGHREPAMKIDKVDVRAAEFRVWCDFCSIRIAPNEEQITVEGKTYHQRCYVKQNPSQEGHIRGSER
jgi:hypothetical protein